MKLLEHKPCDPATFFPNLLNLNFQSAPNIALRISDVPNFKVFHALFISGVLCPTKDNQLSHMKPTQLISI